MPRDERRSTGARGEQIAADWLAERGWRILARNWRCRSGELDIIARDPDGVLVACEVKTRLGLGYGHPLEAITTDKVRRLRRLTLEWVRDQDERVGPVRLDAIAVLFDTRGVATVTHAPNVEAW